MRVLGFVLLVAGLWSVGAAVVEDDPIGLGGIAMALAGVVLLTAGGRALVAWIGWGILTGLCLWAGLALAALGVVLLLAYGELIALGTGLPVRSLVPPAVFVGTGVLLLGVGLGRLWRHRGPP